MSGIKCIEKLSLLSHTKQTSAGLHLGGESQGMIWHNTKQQKILIQEKNMSRDTHTSEHDVQQSFPPWSSVIANKPFPRNPV